MKDPQVIVAFNSEGIQRIEWHALKESFHSYLLTYADKIS